MVSGNSAIVISYLGETPANKPLLLRDPSGGFHNGLDLALGIAANHGFAPVRRSHGSGVVLLVNVNRLLGSGD